MPFFHRKRKNDVPASYSLSALTWKKLKKNRMGMGCLFFLCFLVLLALLGYLITPDHTPYCNEQLLEVRLLKPGTKVQMLSVHKNQYIEKKGPLKKMLFGQPNPCTYVPILSHNISGDSLIVHLFNESEAFARKSFHLADIAYSLNESVPIEKKGNTYIFTTIDNQTVQAERKKMIHYIRNKCLSSKTFLLGTDRFGRDVLSQLIIGIRVSLSIGFISVCIALIIGIFIGAVAGYFGGRTDDLLLWFINVVWSVPSLLLVIAISFVLGSGFWQVFIAIGLTMWVDIARVVRGQFISLREKEYVEASRSLGFRNFTILFKHILPNTIGTLTVISASNFASAILTEAGLSFLGIGVQPPMPSWGNMIKENYGYIILDYAYMAIVPGLAIVCLVLAFMLLGNALRDVSDVRS
ncbi:MAG: ABC transporter permease [Bacteroidales bacterium]|nr:ABC transporter permease [Bacteroidales bacterium]